MKKTKITIHSYKLPERIYILEINNIMVYQHTNKEHMDTIVSNICNALDIYYEEIRRIDHNL